MICRLFLVLATMTSTPTMFLPLDQVVLLKSFYCECYYASSRILNSFWGSIWKHFIPSEAAHVFERGAYFSVEVIPDRLAVISLNTLFWYDANTRMPLVSVVEIESCCADLLFSVVDGCRDHSNDPGALEMDWLEVQLNNFRQRGMQVWLTGHVPPHMNHYYDNCCA